MRSDRRIGCIVPTINVVAEQDFIALSRDHSSVHFARADIDRTTTIPEQFNQMVAAAPMLAAQLAKAEVEAVAFACTSASFFQGPGSDAEIAGAMSAEAKIPAVTTSSAVIEAFQHLDAQRIAIATPYVEWVWRAEREFFQAAGFDVPSIGGQNKDGGSSINRMSKTEVWDLVLSHDHADADIMFVSCTDLPVLGLIGELEQALKKPVVSSNQATYWAVSRILGLGPVDGYGRLLSGM